MLQVQQLPLFTQPAHIPTTQLAPRSHLLQEPQLENLQSTFQRTHLVLGQLQDLLVQVRLPFQVLALQLQIQLESMQLEHLAEPMAPSRPKAQPLALHLLLLQQQLQLLLGQTLPSSTTKKPLPKAGAFCFTS